MKKLVLLLAVVFSASLFSCGNSKDAAAATDSIAADTVNVEVVEAVEAVDTVTGDTIVAAAAADTAVVVK